ncbi:peptidase [Paludisphaera rhizosphaerae]|uniref:peptidase n=1 Tax=Paludisphaera rhizosphaerae TaxID=2711216 RepID=UPI0013EE2CB8|nr:peptidase [Paludisphaera rhizosphaerae]
MRQPRPRSFPLLAATATVLALATTAIASSPSLTAVRPMGGQRGAEVEVVFSGARLGDAQEVMFYQPGVTATGITKIDDNSFKAKVKISADAPLGFRDLRVRTATGVSELRGFSVGAMPEVSEKEPNNDFEAPQSIPMNVVVNGVAENEDVDYFVVEAKKGERISAEVEGMRLGITLFDPYVAILNAKRFELASSDDAALLWQDAFASIVAPEDGKYIVQVRESAYAGNANCLYRLHVGNFPRSTGVYPPGGRPNQKLAVKWIGDPAGEASSEVALPAETRAGWGVQRQDDKGFSPTPNAFRLAELDNVLEVEPNDDQATATPFTAPAALNGVLGKAGDADHFVFTGKKGQVFDLRVLGRKLRSPIDSVLYIAKKGGGAIAGSDDSNGPDSYIRQTLPDDGEYVVSIVDQLKKGGPDYIYRIEVTTPEPSLTVSTPAEQIMLGTGVMAVSVPKGGRQAILIQGSRTDFGGEVQFSIDGLPPGVEVEIPPLAASQALVPILFKAKPDAAPAGALVEVVGKSVDPNVKVKSHFDTLSAFVLAPNNNGIIMWSRSVDRLAVAATEESPFALEIVQPKAPLVRSGQMGLKVRAIRKPDFKAAIAVSLPWNPPGVGSGGGIAIPEGQDEAVIPINADGNAELRTWKIVVNGTGTGPGGPVMVSSQLADLTIAAPYVGLAFQNASVEQGKETDMAVTVSKNVDFPGEASVTLIGLPNKATTDAKKITKDSTDLTFHIKTDPASPVGKHANLFCQVVVTQDGEPITHNIGTGTLQIDAPLPPKPAAAAPAAAPAPAQAAKPAEAPAKPLSRLEKLRLEAKQKAGANP